MIGEKLSPILSEIEETLWEFEANVKIPPKYSEDGFRAGVKIFMSVLLDKMWELQEKEGIPMDIRGAMSQKLGETVRNVVKTYTDIDTHKLYNKYDSDNE